MADKRDGKEPLTLKEELFAILDRMDLNDKEKGRLILGVIADRIEALERRPWSPGHILVGGTASGGDAPYREQLINDPIG